MKVKKITSLDALEQWREDWDKFLFSSRQNCIFLTQEWFYSLWKNLSDSNSLAILVFKDKEGNISGIAPLMKKGKRLQFIACQEVSDYCDFIYSTRSNEFYMDFLNYLNEYFRDTEEISLMNIKQSSPTLDILSRLAEKNHFSFSCSEIEVAPFLILPSSYEAR